MKRTSARLILDRAGDVQEFSLHPGIQILGRSKKSCELSVADGSLSKQHVELELDDSGALTVTDLGSKNGTEINGKQTRGGSLVNGDELRCGKVTFRVAGLPEAPEARARSRAPVADADMTQSGTFLQLLETDTKVPMAGDVLTVGSKSENDVVVSGEGVSRYHAELIYEEAAWWIRDLGARNGVKVNGERIEDSRKLTNGDEIQLGTSRMRFDVVASSPLASAHKAAFQLARDPMGAVKNDPRVRRGLAAALAAAVLLVIAGSGGGGGLVSTSASRANGPWLQEGTKALLAANYEEARNVFRRRANVYSEEGDATPRTLSQIASQWLSLQERGPRVFRWEKATELLGRTARLRGLPPELRSWLEKQTDRVDLNAKAVALLEEAEQLGAQADALAQDGKLEHALETYERASSRYESIDVGSMVAREALDGGAKLAAKAFDRVTADLQAGAKAKRPNWRHLLQKIDRAQRFAVDTKDRALLRRLGEACRTNIEDEARFVEAGTIIKQQDPSRYEQARKLLKDVDPRSKIHPDALAYLEWLEADTKVRAATQAYTRAFGKRAFKLLGEAYACRSLGAEAKKSISTRRMHWSRVVKAYERGMASSHRGDKLDALEDLERVLVLEQAPSNRFRVRAQEEIKNIRATLSGQLQKRLSSGLSALQHGKLRKANDWFEEVRADPTKTDQDLERIRAAVAQRNAKEKMLPKAKRELITDSRENFLKLRDVFQLLARWLPRKHEDRAEAKKHLKVVAARIRHWEKAAEDALK